MVLAYTLVKTDTLPQQSQLLETVAAPSTTANVAQQLAANDFIPESSHGKLIVAMIAKPEQADKIVSVLQGTESAEDMAAVQQLMQPVGEGQPQAAMSPDSAATGATNSTGAGSSAALSTAESGELSHSRWL